MDKNWNLILWKRWNWQWQAPYDVNLPHPGEILIKVLVLLHKPYLNKNYGEYICALLYNIGGLLHAELGELFNDNFKIVGKFIKDNNSPLKLQSMLLKLFRST